MSENLNGMFTATTETVSTSTRGLAGTAQLTALANSLTATIIKTIDDDIDTYKELFEASKTDHNMMDKLVTTLCNISLVDISCIETLSKETQNAMLKSQQSKRSRSKGKVMTLDNYRNMMSGALAELLLRRSIGKEKSATGSRRGAGTIEYTEEQLAAFANDQNDLKRELRNVQSKKSIMKSKADFTEDDERWQQLLTAEANLKSLRTASVTTVKTVVVDETRDKLLEALGDKDIDSLKANEAKALIKKLLEQTSEESQAESDTQEEEETK